MTPESRRQRLVDAELLNGAHGKPATDHAAVFSPEMEQALQETISTGERNDAV